MSNPEDAKLEALLEAAIRLQSSNPDLQALSPEEMRYVMLHTGLLQAREEAGNLVEQFPSLRPNVDYWFEFPAIWNLGMSSDEEYVSHAGEAMDVMFSPSRLWEYISNVSAGEPGARALAKVFPIAQDLSPKELQLLDAMHRDLQLYNVLKFSKDNTGQPLSKEKYLETVRVLLPLDRLCEPGIRPTLQAYLDAELGNAMILEEQVYGGRKKPHLRLRVMIGARPASQVSGVLEAFVKLYPAEKVAEAELETALNHYLGNVAAFPCINRTKLVKLPEPLRLEETTFSYAMIMPFAEMKTVEQCLVDDPVSRDGTLLQVVSRVRDLHTYGIPNSGILRILELSKEQASPEQREEIETDLQALRQRFFMPQGPIKIHNYLEERREFVEPEGVLDHAYRKYGIPNILNANAFAYLSLVHGDLQTRNELRAVNDIFFLDFATAHIGAPQIDLAKLLTYRGIDCAWEEQQAYLTAYQKSRDPTRLLADTLKLGPDHVNYPELFMLGYHAAIIRNTLIHLKHVATHPQEYTDTKRTEALQKDYGLLTFHGERITPAAAAELVAAAKQEFKFV